MITVHRAADRFAGSTDWLQERCSFSFGDHYDPANTHHGVLLANNDETVAPEAGFDTHPHCDVEIVTWVVSGSLVHQDSRGHAGVVHPGLAQRMSAGTGVLHSERNDRYESGLVRARAVEPVRFVQMWVLPDEPGVAPGYAQADVSAELAAGGLVPLASGLVDAAITIGAAATLLVARPGGAALVLPDARFLHVYVVSGAVEMEGAGVLSEGDSVRTVGGGQRLSGTGEALVWAMERRLGEPVPR